jgi:hypothetical protein
MTRSRAFDGKTLWRLPKSFPQVQLLAKELKLLKVRVVSMDGSKFKADASKHRSLSFARAGKSVNQLKLGDGAVTAPSAREVRCRAGNSRYSWPESQNPGTLVSFHSPARKAPAKPLRKAPQP